MPRFDDSIFWLQKAGKQLILIYNAFLNKLALVLLWLIN